MLRGPVDLVGFFLICFGHQWASLVVFEQYRMLTYPVLFACVVIVRPAPFTTLGQGNVVLHDECLDSGKSAEQLPQMSPDRRLWPIHCLSTISKTASE